MEPSSIILFLDGATMKLCMIGTGYVGLVTGCCFADMGNDVICVDNNREKIERLKKGAVDIYEPGLSDLMRRNLSHDRLSFTTDLAYGVKNAEIIFIAVGTPPNDDGKADTSQVMNVARSIGKAMNGYKIVVTKSTVPVGTTESVGDAVARETNHPFDIVSNPEFLKEGAAVEDFMRPERIVIGSRSPKAIEGMRELYAPYTRTGNPILVMDIRSAELSKYAANALLATKISFMNEIANLCDHLGADIESIRLADRRRFSNRPQVPIRGRRFRRIVFSEGPVGADSYCRYRCLSGGHYSCGEGRKRPPARRIRQQDTGPFR